jgi:uncharacterized protein YjbI with pentapeptide repeats
VTVGRLLRVRGSALVIAVAFVTPVLATAPATPASADTVIDGCTIVSNPTPTHFTNCAGSDLAGADFSGLNLSHANFASSTFADCGYSDCAAVVLTDANLTDANLSDIVVWAGVTFADPSIPPPTPPVGSAFAGVDFTGANLSGANLTGIGFGGANLTDANLTDANLSGAAMEDQVTSTGFVQVTVDESATLTGANFTGTIVMPSNQSVTATSQAGAVATWSMPPAIAGTTPGACTPASGSTFPLFSSTVTCQVTDNFGGVASGTFQVNVLPTTQYFTRVLVPSDGAVLVGAPYVDAAATDAPGVTNVAFELSGNGLSDQVIGTATRTLFGWVAKWNTTSVSNGTYSLQSVASDAANNTDASEPITVTVNNQPPTTAVLIPSGGASLSGPNALLDASASSAVGIASVTYEVNGNGLTNQVVATGTPTRYGYLAQWNTTAVHNGTYNLVSVATDTVAEATTSAPVSVTVDNAPPTTAMLIPSTGTTQSGTTALLDASSSANVTTVTYELSGGPSNLSDQPIATGTLTYYGWLAEWNTTTVPNATYSLVSVAAYANGVSTTSAPVTINVNN